MTSRSLVAASLIFCILSVVPAGGNRTAEGNITPISLLDEPVVRIKVQFEKGQASRMSANFALETGHPSEIEWRVELPEGLRGRVAFGLNQDRKRDDDENLADHLTHGSRTSGHYGDVGERVHISRVAYVDDKGVHQALTEELASQHPQLAAILRDGFIVSAHRVAPASPPQCVGGSGGSPHELTLPAEWKWQSIDMKGGGQVDSIRFNYIAKGGKTHAFWIGGPGGSSCGQPFVLTEGEYITKIRGKYGDAIDSIQFITNKDRKSELCGGQGGAHDIRIDAPPGQAIIGFRARCGRLVDQLCPVFGPIPES